MQRIPGAQDLVTEAPEGNLLGRSGWAIFGGTGVFGHASREVKTGALRKSSLRPSQAVIYIRVMCTESRRLSLRHCHTTLLRRGRAGSLPHQLPAALRAPGAVRFLAACSRAPLQPTLWIEWLAFHWLIDCDLILASFPNMPPPPSPPPVSRLVCMCGGGE
uniref:Uncharacterized protein n=1 Tax=Pipistrellus kuhlii TaxID=59472 RepID=A0A7J8B1T9_PIPKU|nr:hypothetical protein mPipKuh1_007693 [Pipistrellus kuhlii]